MNWPDRLKIAFKYSELRVFSLTGGTWYDHFRLNYPGQPASTGTETPRYWDLFMTEYDKCYCSGSRVYFAPVLTTADTGEWVVYPYRGTDPAGSDIDQACEMKYAKRRALGAASNNPVRSATLNHSCTVKRLYGNAPSGVNYECEYAVPPNRTAYWNIVGYTDDTTVTNLAFRVTIVYYCHLYEKLDATN